ncbi:hypothetical protein C8N46_104146 [Kordia periserrulae]|uniref:Uncharacterized protein n=1 Tax=Kordia periserrulae TaxID=701523 RepID=A0A2T6BZL0_9FLAO|nr:hypothetical protein [Kordia periserrulae]PTX61503.1 hypothetical protein C8N46_104146 [Kordia periserrulae]
MKESNSKVILVIVVGFMFIAGYLFWKTDYDTSATVLFCIALGVGILSFFIESAIVWVWEKFALALGWINTRIILSLVFFIFLTPFAVLSRVFSKNSSLKLKNKENTTFVERNHTYTKKDLENIW